LKANFLKALQFALFLGLGIFLVWWSLSGLTPDAKQNIIKTFSQGNYSWLILAGVFAVLSNISRAIRWQMLIEPVAKRPGLVNTFLSVMIGYLANLAFPRLGEFARCGTLSRYEGISPAVAFGTVIAERIIDLLSLVLLVLLLIVTQFKVISGYFTEKIADPLWLKITNITSNPQSLVLLLVGIALGLLALKFMSKQFGQTTFYQKTLDFGTTILSGIQSVRQVKNLPMFIVHSIFIWFMYLMMNYVCFFTTDVTSHLSIGVALATLVFGTFGMIATQGGVGAYQLIVAGLLTIYGIQYDLGYGFSWIIWGMQTIMMLLGGFVSLIALPIYNRSNNQ
jgi:hypothetical protein